MTYRPCLLVLLTACGSGTTSVSSADAGVDADASISSDAPPYGEAPDDAGDAGSLCNTIVNDGPVIPVTQVAANPPAPQGGTIRDGTYWGTSLTIYTGPNGPTGTTGTFQTTALIEGSTVQLVANGNPARRTITLTPADGGFTSVDTCPGTQMAEGGYTATPTTLTFFLPGGTDDAGPRTVVEVLTRQ
jgi:hypothetical protein